MTQSNHPLKVAAMYKFVSLPDYQDLREPLLEFCKTHAITGTLLLAEEGINGTVAGTAEDIETLVKYLHGGNIFTGRLNGIDIKYSAAEKPPFMRMKVRLKKEIVTLRAPEADPSKIVGTYIEPKDWNDTLEQADIILDTRNDYEVAIGTFKGAIDPETDKFTEFKDYVAQNLDPNKQKKVAMFCTGGIRCEKASAYMLSQGFEEVFHLKGGILRYLEEIPEEESAWEGDCFVFDDRVSIKHGLEIGDYRLCFACRRPLAPEDFKHPDFIEGIQCHQCKDEKSEKARAALKMRQKQVKLAQKRGMAHLGDQADKDARARHLQKLAEKKKAAEASLKGRNKVAQNEKLP